MTQNKTSKGKKWRLIVLVLIALGIVTHFSLSYSPPNRPSGYQWVHARIAGGGEPDYPIEGTVESRFEDFLERHPEFQPQWRDVPDDQNGLIQLQTLILSEDIEAKLGMDSKLLDIYRGDSPWDQAVVEKYLQSNSDLLERLREIALLPQRSSKGMGQNRDRHRHRSLIHTASISLDLSCAYHMKNDMDLAYRDFTAIFGIAAHFDQHETSDFLDVLRGISIKRDAMSAISQHIHELPHSTNWSPFIHHIESQPDPWIVLSKACLGTAWSFMQYSILPTYVNDDEPNPAWNFTAFEDGYARLLINLSHLYKKHRYHLDLAHYQAIDRRNQHHHKSLPPELNELLLLANQDGWTRACKGHFDIIAYTLTAMKILEIEQQSGPITDPKDPRLNGISTSPFDGPTFEFDPVTREVLLGPTSNIRDDYTITLPPYPGNKP